MLPLAPSPAPDAYVPRDELHKPQPTYPLDVLLCRRCGHAQLGVVVRPESLYGDYIYETASSLGLVEHFTRYADAVLERTRLPQGSLVVDIGSNDGSLLRRFAARGMRVLGIDPARAIAARATASGIETLPAFFDRPLALEIRADRGAAALVTANNVYANVDNVDELTEAVRDLLAPDGLFILESSYLVDLIRNMIWDFIYLEHLSYFSATPLAWFFDRHGLELVHVERVPTKGGSLRCTVKLEGGPHLVSRSVNEVMELETEFGVARPERFAAFRAQIEERGGALRELLWRLNAEGKTIDGYGASATTTTFLYHYAIGGALRHLVDDNPARQDRFSPGLHIPVLASDVLVEDPPDYVLVLAWRYAEPIMRKHQAYAARGGRFIVPLPELAVV